MSVMWLRLAVLYRMLRRLDARMRRIEERQERMARIILSLQAVEVGMIQTLRESGVRFSVSSKGKVNE